MFLTDKPVFIYKITNLVNNKVYIGQTSQKPRHRLTRHFSDAKKGSDLYFCRAIRKYGRESFSIEILKENLTREDAHKEEVNAILEYKADNPEFGYNTTLGGLGGLPTELARQRMSEAQQRIWSDPLRREKQVLALTGKMVGDLNPMFGKTGEKHHSFGKHHNRSVREKLSDTRKELFQNPEFKARMTAANVGKHHTEMGRANIAKALVGNQYRKGIPHSDEIKKKIGESVRRTKEANRLAKLQQATLDTLQSP